ncbi:TetR/AcrR family transcriptional regulator [Streptomyces triticirhizae]|uniref:TetR/AcrR family transcriptional regulator n=1 Tax=Streptomyces triticirhizae TaxID=2483353 RepID=A0A3M2M673_9ACTN|nr:TetR/AcrR family transcriptional regulator [Streptomyces triticirhizae]RMI45187.1 TetR/AcrR family transcriptional regulator [Streptomyces triticirhizae]
MADTAVHDGPPARGGYHHGDLPNALTEAAVALASEGGPGAVVLRAAARRVGVSATAAYRHFAGHADLLRAVKERSQRLLDASVATALAASPPLPERGDEAERRLRAIAEAYVSFALGQPGLFRSCFCHTDDENPPDPRAYGTYQLLREVLDELAEAGRVSPGLREDAEAAVWSTVHGLATLLLDGPLSVLPEPRRRAVVERSLDGMVHGLRS